MSVSAMDAFCCFFGSFLRGMTGSLACAFRSFDKRFGLHWVGAASIYPLGPFGWIWSLFLRSFGSSGSLDSGRCTFSFSFLVTPSLTCFFFAS